MPAANAASSTAMGSKTACSGRFSEVFLSVSGSPPAAREARRETPVQNMFLESQMGLVLKLQIRCAYLKFSCPRGLRFQDSECLPPTRRTISSSHAISGCGCRPALLFLDTLCVSKPPRTARLRTGSVFGFPHAHSLVKGFRYAVRI